ncbi:MAG: DUF6119 family protein [Bacillota bacterium]
MYLIKEHVQDFTGLLEDKGFEELTQAVPLPFDCKVHLQRTESTPKWSSYFGRFFAIEPTKLTNVTCSFVCLLKVEGSVFAVTFGQGFHAIRRNLVEPKFGLRCTLNLTDPGRIKVVDTRRIDLVTRQQRETLLWTGWDTLPVRPLAAGLSRTYPVRIP